MKNKELEKAKQEGRDEERMNREAIWDEGYVLGHNAGLEHGKDEERKRILTEVIKIIRHYELTEEIVFEIKQKLEESE